MLGLSRLPIAVAPARHETLASYLDRLAALHGLHPREIWESVGSPSPGTRRRTVHLDLLAAITGRPAAHLARALPELRDPAPDWAAWRHQPQPGCARCDARHHGGPVLRLLPHHRYVCSRHRSWIGPPDYGQPSTLLDDELRDVVRAQRRHQRLVHRHGSAVTYDAVLTGFLFCGHLWGDEPRGPVDAWYHWTRRAHWLIPHGSEQREFSASRLFAAVYPEAVDLAAVVVSTRWRRYAGGSPEQQQRFVAEIGLRLGLPDYRPPATGDAIAHWAKFDSSRPPSAPTLLFPVTRTSAASVHGLRRNERSATWFSVNRRGGTVLLHHRHLRPVLIREWSRPMDGIEAAIWASGTVHDVAGSELSAGGTQVVDRRRESASASSAGCTTR